MSLAGSRTRGSFWLRVQFHHWVTSRWKTEHISGRRRPWAINMAEAYIDSHMLQGQKHLTPEHDILWKGRIWSLVQLDSTPMEKTDGWRSVRTFLQNKSGAIPRKLPCYIPAFHKQNSNSDIASGSAKAQLLEKNWGLWKIKSSEKYSSSSWTLKTVLTLPASTVVESDRIQLLRALTDIRSHYIVQISDACGVWKSIYMELDQFRAVQS